MENLYSVKCYDKLNMKVLTLRLKEKYLAGLNLFGPV